MKIKWPTVGKKVFIPTGDYYEIAYLGWGDVRTHFAGYIMGYKKAADVLVTYALKSNDIKILDTFVFPICFNYRQYLELIMKDMYMKYSGDPKEVQETKIKKMNHSLLKAWNVIKPILERYCDSEEEAKDMQAVEEYIKDFHNTDNDAEKFRYPITKKLVRKLGKENRINLKNLKDRMDELENYFEAVIAKIEYTIGLM